MNDRTYDALLRGCRFSTQIGSYTRPQPRRKTLAKKLQPDVTVEAHVHRETQLGLLVSPDGEREKAAWLAKSLIEFTQKPGSDIATVTLPEWKARQHGLI